jgi:hypothetical protein
MGVASLVWPPSPAVLRDKIHGGDVTGCATSAMQWQNPWLELLVLQPFDKYDL